MINMSIRKTLAPKNKKATTLSYIKLKFIISSIRSSSEP
jgi:hypothetical protein